MGDQSRVFVRKLLIWYKKAARMLPWRHTRNPYAILVSEFMLQQTNVRRVLSRVFGNAKFGMRNAELWQLASTLVPKNGNRAWKFNQAMMELGALVCTARAPKCQDCPVKHHCRYTARLNSRIRNPG